MPSATLKDIAKLVGVSVNTVSRALKDKPDIGLKTRERVKEAASALGYRPNLNARSLVLRKTSIIGVAVTEPDNPVRMELCEKLRSYAERDGYRLLTTSLDYDWDTKNLDAIEDLLARRVDGMIIGAIWGLTGEQPLGALLQECRQNETPVVVFGQPQTELADCVEINFPDSAFRLTSHLLEKGYRKIVFFDSLSGSLKTPGYLHAMKEHHMEKKIAVWEVSASRMETAFASAEEYLLKFKYPPEAIIAPNDLGALGIIAALRKHHIRVPEDCAVVGFDNITYGEYFDPSLTTIGYDNGIFAETVWSLMIRRLKKTETGPAKRICIPQKLIVRKSG